MNRSEFASWANDIGSRLPEVKEYFKKLPKDTRDHWFEDVFVNLDLADCYAVNLQLMTDPPKNRYDMQAIPATVSKLASDIAFNRQQRQQAVKERSKNQQPLEKHFDSKMNAGVTALKQWQREQAEQGIEISDQDRKAFVDRWFDENDSSFDDEENMPRYKCITCLDRGLVNYRSVLDRHRTYCGYCPKCEAGQKRKEALRVGPAVVKDDRLTKWE